MPNETRPKQDKKRAKAATKKNNNALNRSPILKSGQSSDGFFYFLEFVFCGNGFVARDASSTVCPWLFVFKKSKAKPSHSFCGEIQTRYAWGKVGSSSSVATLKRQQSEQLRVPFALDEGKPYAELWIGTHPSAPSKVDGKLLSDVIAQSPEKLVGKNTVQMFGGASLPFLLKVGKRVFFFFVRFFSSCLSSKVLSVKQALSIQAHPDKVLAEELHRKFPDIYKDPNHKPEMTLALTPFEVLCGFRPPAQVIHNLSAVPELRALIGEETSKKAEQESSGSNVLRLVFGALMTASDDAVKTHLANLIARLRALAEPSDLEKAILRIHDDYPGDVGVFCPYILNHFVLAPGEAVFLGPNEPHAYLSGDCVECMATSDNVVRAGLTPKLRDCGTLLSMLTYAVREPQALIGESVVPGVVGYYPPVPDFQVEVWNHMICVFLLTVSFKRFAPQLAAYVSLHIILLLLEL